MSSRPVFFDSLLLATGNRGKYEEFSALLPEEMTGRLLFAPAAFPGGAPNGGAPNVEETGTTYASNAVLKALAWAEASGLPSLADDSGIEVEALGWRPGLFSARAAPGTDADRNRWLLERMAGRAEGERRARFVAAVALSVPGRWTLVCEGACNGRLALDAGMDGGHGFGYDPLFIPDGCDRSFGELPSEVKNKISHRAEAVRVLMALLRERNAE
ncbi:MAG: non-canonical purine NTP pyrophosphatase, RdgB/HAM1 family [Synergistaceae bacterium]|jgi:XTP/dITP diphosphohydrolase|nr:non-canonical purine NTP pyrophosphatase, RdgB/HAM1 family [Synergistaceae bacterium]